MHAQWSTHPHRQMRMCKHMHVVRRVSQRREVINYWELTSSIWERRFLWLREFRRRWREYKEKEVIRRWQQSHNFHDDNASKAFAVCKHTHISRSATECSDAVAHARLSRTRHMVTKFGLRTVVCRQVHTEPHAQELMTIFSSHKAMPTERTWEAWPSLNELKAVTWILWRQFCAMIRWWYLNKVRYNKSYES